MIPQCRILIAFLILGSMPPALAQSGTPAERRACSLDVKRFCKAAITGGDLVILVCLQQNRAKISAACSQVLSSHGH